MLFLQVFKLQPSKFQFKRLEKSDNSSLKITVDVSEPHIEIYVENLQFWRRVTPIFRTFSSISVFYIGFLSVIFFPVFLVKVNYSMKYCMSEFLFCFRPP